MSVAALAVSLGACAHGKPWLLDMQASEAAFREGRLENAEALALKAGARARPAGHLDGRVADALAGLAATHQAKSRYAKAEELYRRALAMREARFGPDHSDNIATVKNLADLLSVQGRNADAEPLYRRALDMIDKAGGSERAELVGVLNDLALLYQTAGRFDEAEPLYQRALGVIEKKRGLEHPEVAGQLLDLALLHHSRGQPERAEPLYRRALAITEKVYGEGHAAVAESLNNLALFYESRGMHAKAEPLYRRALKILDGAGQPQPALASTLENYADLLRRMGRSSEAAQLRGRARVIRDRLTGPNRAE